MSGPDTGFANLPEVPALWLPIVDHQNIETAQSREQIAEASVGTGQRKIAEERCTSYVERRMPIAARLLCQRAGDTPLRKSLRRTRPRASPPPTAFPAESPVTTSPPKYCPHFQQAAPVPPKFISYGCNCMDGAYGTTSLFAKIRWVQLPNELSLPICARTPVPAKCERTNEHTGTDHSPRTGRSEFANQTQSPHRTGRQTKPG